MALIMVLTSCIKDYEKVEGETYPSIFMAEDLDIEISYYNIYISPVCGEFDESFDLQSRSFYNSLDTSLSYTGKVPVKKFNGGYRELPSAIDWRLKGIDVYSLEDFDTDHPAGSSLNDLCQIWYDYKHCRVIRPLTDICYGTLMLTDYYKSRGESGAGLKIYLYDSSVDIPEMKAYPDYKKIIYEHTEESAFPKVEVRITDGFGRDFVARSE